MSYSNTCRRTSPRRYRANGAQADVLANQAEALLRELKSNGTPSHSPSPAYIAVASVSPAALPLTPESVRPPPLKSTLISQYRHVSPTRSHVLEVFPQPSPDPIKSRREVEERLNLPLVEAQGKIEQLLLQLDVSMETQKTLSQRLEEARKQAQDAMLKAADAHELRAENEALRHKLTTKCIEGESLSALKDEKDSLAARVAVLEAEVARLMELVNKAKVESDRKLDAQKAELQAAHDTAYQQLLQEKDAADAEIARMMEAAVGVHDSCKRELEEQKELTRAAEQDIERLTAMLQEAASEADAKDKERNDLTEALQRLEGELNEYRERSANGDNALEDMLAKLRAKDDALSAKDEELANKNAELAKKDKELAELEDEIAEKDRQLAAKDRDLADSITEKDRELTNILASKDKELADSLAGKNKELAAKLADLNRELAHKAKELADERNARNSVLSAKESESTEIIARLQCELRAAEGKIIQQKYELESLTRNLDERADNSQALFDTESRLAELSRALEMAKQSLLTEQAKAERVAEDEAAARELLENELASVRAELQAEREKAARDLQAERERAGRNMQSDRENADKDLQSLRDAAAAEIKDLKQREMSLMAAADKAEHRATLLEAEVKRLVDALADKDRSMKAALEAAERRLKEEQQAAASLRDSLHAQITALQRSKVAGIEETDNLVSDLTNQLSQARLAKQKCEADKEDVRMKYERQVQDVKNAMNKAAHEYDMKLQALTSEHERALQKLKEDIGVLHVQEIDSLKAYHGREVSNIRSSAQMEIEAAARRRDEELRDMAERFQALSNELSTKNATVEFMERELSDLRKALEAAAQKENELRVSITKQCCIESKNEGTMTEVAQRAVEAQTEDVRRVTLGTQAEIKDERVEMELKVHREALERAKKLAAQESLARNKRVEELETVKRAAVQEAFAKGQLVRELEGERERLEQEVADREARMQALLEEVRGLRAVGGRYELMKAEAEGVQEKLQEALEQLLAKKKDVERLEDELQACQSAAAAATAAAAAAPPPSTRRSAPYTPTPTTPVTPLLSRPPPGRGLVPYPQPSFQPPPPQPAFQPPPPQMQPQCYPYHHVEVEVVSETQPCVTSVCNPPRVY